MILDLLLNCQAKILGDTLDDFILRADRGDYERMI